MASTKPSSTSLVFRPTTAPDLDPITWRARVERINQEPSTGARNQASWSTVTVRHGTVSAALHNARESRGSPLPP